jgi:hypothetical protein
VIREEQVLLILGKWHEESTPLHVVARFSECVASFDARIVNFSPRCVSFDLCGKYDMCEICIENCFFDYSKPRDLESSRVGNRIFSCGLKALRPTGECMMIMEIAS